MMEERRHDHRNSWTLTSWSTRRRQRASNLGNILSLLRPQNPSPATHILPQGHTSYPFPNNSTNCGPSMQTHEPMRHSHSNHHTSKNNTLNPNLQRYMHIWTYFTLHISYLSHCCDKIPEKYSLRKQFILAHSWGVAIAARAWDSWSHCIYRQEAESDEYQFSGHLLLYISQLRWIFLPQLSGKVSYAWHSRNLSLVFSRLISHPDNLLSYLKIISVLTSSHLGQKIRFCS